MCKPKTDGELLACAECGLPTTYDPERDWGAAVYCPACNATILKAWAEAERRLGPPEQPDFEEG